ncbi:hypothetical protein [Roseomonas chloroacetimidivorans]|uniref:hypothetical protein n=1 Tax=Roseomonas chloroacetimidivorans TaxID=1766656 RepID=UPI003C736F87
MERELTGATLVAGVGDPRENAFCLMSLVAHLAGEQHSDRPDAASPLIRDFAVVINDALPHARRQRLKLYAPRIIGTNDGRDAERAEMLLREMAHAILPRLACEVFLLRARAQRGGPLGRLRSWIAALRLEGQIVAALREIEGQVPLQSVRHPGGLTAGLLVLGAKQAAFPRQRVWYWREMLSLLDRLCDPPGLILREKAVLTAPIDAGKADPGSRLGTPSSLRQIWPRHGMRERSVWQPHAQSAPDLQEAVEWGVRHAAD